jgi:DNA replicative helicase MCM subunit Mcm2 (Cdc46/Mcm family)
VKASSIGKLLNIKGIITRATEVKPMMQVRLVSFSLNMK